MAPDQDGAPAAVDDYRSLNPDDFPSVGFREYLRALLAFRQADAAMHVAQMAGGHGWRWQEFERAVALGRVEWVKRQIADDLLFAVRLAGALFPGQLDLLLRDLPTACRLRRAVRRLCRDNLKLKRAVAALAGRRKGGAA